MLGPRAACALALVAAAAVPGTTAAWRMHHPSSAPASAFGHGLMQMAGAPMGDPFLDLALTMPTAAPATDPFPMMDALFRDILGPFGHPEAGRKPRARRPARGTSGTGGGTPVTPRCSDPGAASQTRSATHGGSGSPASTGEGVVAAADSNGNSGGSDTRSSDTGGQAGQDTRAHTSPPPPEIREAEAAWHIALDTAGFAKAELSITLEGTQSKGATLVVKGVKVCGGDGASGASGACFPRSLTRKYDLGSDRIDRGGIVAARSDDGALHITLPKLAPPPPRAIEISGVQATPMHAAGPSAHTGANAAASELPKASVGEADGTGAP